ncbi:MAG: ADP-ribosylglycohydrolase family protein [Candidatus Dormibacteraeota bacterium]|nr:ADP-ribosylglycohydrolase family protein [Candidatus Dormibacteraeota bacterium]
MDYRGDRSFPAPWLDDLGYPQELRSLADSLLDLPGPALAGDSPTGGGTLPVDLTDNWAQAPLRTTSSRSPDRVSRILGYLLGGAIGDALGAPIEFSNLRDIRKAHGPAGVTGYVPGHWGPGAFTDDTQMTLFTAEGLIRADNRRRESGLQDVPLVLWGAYRRWLETQETRARPKADDSSIHRGWLVDESALRAQRAPGTTCLAALRSGTPGSIEAPPNNSKGCGGVMRVAPIGLVADDPFDLGCAAAALTRGHPSGYLAAGMFAAVVAGVTQGEPPAIAIDRSLETLRGRPGHEETVKAVQQALALAASGRGPSPELVETLGGGWIAEEALAITLYCVIVAPDFRQGVLLAVNHSGDSDSTGSMVGNLLGATLGLAALPGEWLRELEAWPVIERVASDLAAQFVGASATFSPDMDRYPPS